jgi:hypothetical protein
MRPGLWFVGTLLAVSPLRGADISTATFPLNQTLNSSHFTLHHQSPFAPPGILNVLEGLHAKLLLDLGAFSGWAYVEKIPVYLYESAESYHAGTGMPEWSGAYVDLTTRAVHAYDGPGFQRVMAHELAHLFFTRFFQDKMVAPPVWLNEGDRKSVV